MPRVMALATMRPLKNKYWADHYVASVSVRANKRGDVEWREAHSLSTHHGLHVFFFFFVLQILHRESGGSTDEAKASSFFFFQCPRYCQLASQPASPFCQHLPQERERTSAFERRRRSRRRPFPPRFSRRSFFVGWFLLSFWLLL